MSSEAMNNNEMNNDLVHDKLHLCRLHDTSRYTVADSDPDVRGWEVVGSDGTRIGKVDDLVIDPQAKKVRYLDVEIESSLINQQKGHYLLIPIGLADLHEKEDQIIVQKISTSTLGKHNFHSGGPISREYEESIHTSFGDSGDAGDTRSAGNIGNSFYNQSSFDEGRFHSAFRERRGQRGFMTGLSGNVSAFNSGTSGV